MAASFRLDGRRAIVTGASRGLGAAMTRALAEAGADVAGVATGDLAATGSVVRDRGRRFVAIAEDLADTDAPGRIVARAVEAFGGVDILVNNAGIIRRADALDFTQEDWNDVLDVNLKAAFFLAQAVARRLVEQRHGGKIVNVASMLSFQGGVRVASYTASKSGILGLTRLLANEWAACGINVNAIAPVFTLTAINRSLLAEPSKLEWVMSRIPMKRLGELEDLFGPVIFLASDASNFVNGHVLPVDGGWLGA